MICPNCGKENNDGAKFCAGCGKNFDAGGSAPDANRFKKNAKLAGLGFGALALLVLFDIVKIPFFNDSPGKTLEKSFSAIAAGKYGDFKETLSRDTAAQMDSMAALSGTSMAEGMREGRKEIENKKGVKKIEILNEEIKGDTAYACLKITYGDGSVDEGDDRCADLVKEGGAWKINY